MSCLSVREIHASFFSRSHSSTSSPFKLVHCDVWISFVLSTSGFRYYLVVLDDFSHLCWTFPLCHMSDVHQRLVESVAYDKTLFGLPIKCFQADNGTEFANQATNSFFASYITMLRLSCPYTSRQNGKSRMHASHYQQLYLHPPYQSIHAYILPG